MERSGMRGFCRRIFEPPDYAALHPGYGWENQDLGHDRPAIRGADGEIQSLAKPESLRLRRSAIRRGSQARVRRVFRIDPRHAQSFAMGRPHLDAPVRRHGKARGRHQGIDRPLSGLAGSQARARSVRRGDSELGASPRSALARRRPDLVLGRGTEGDHAADMDPGDAFLQSPDPSPRPGALHDHAMRRPPERYRSDDPAGERVTTIAIVSNFYCRARPVPGVYDLEITRRNVS